MVYFISDIHLGLGSEESNRKRERALLAFLEFIRSESVGGKNVEALYIIGDLFDYWFDYRTVIPRGFTRTLGGLASVVDAGIRVEYLMGNHDFGHRDYFEHELGIQVHSGDVERVIAGRRCYLSHGDGKAFNDTGYVILKKILRARLSQFAFRLLHPDIGIGIAARASHRSREHTSQKYYGGERPGEDDGLYAFAKKKIEEENFDLVVMGHAHVARDVNFNGGRYVNLGSWLGDSWGYLVVDEEKEDLIINNY